MSYLRKLTASVFLINAFVIVLAATSAYQGYRQYQERAEVTTQNLAYALESNLVNAIQRVDVSLLALLDIYASQRTLSGGGAALLNRQIEQIRLRLPEVDAIRITDRHGVLIYGSGVDPAAKLSLADRHHFKQLRDDPGAALVVSQPQVSRINEKWVLVLARRVNQPDGGFGGMIFAAVTLDYLTRYFAALDLGPGGAVALRDNEQRLIARYPELKTVGLAVGQKFAAPELRALLAAGKTAGTYFTRVGSGNTARTATFRKLGDYPLYTTVGVATTDYLAAWRSDTSRLAILVTLFLLASLYAAKIQYRSWQRRQEFNATLLRQEALYHELVEDTPVMVARYRPDTTITFANTAYAEFFGAAPGELVGRPWLDFIPDETDRAAARERIAALTPDQPALSSVQHRVLGKDGQTHWTQWTDRAFFDAAGTLTHLHSVGEDITERRRLRNIQEARLRLMEYAIDHSLKELLVATLDEAGVLTESPVGFYHFLEADQKTLALQAWSTRTSSEYCKAAGEGRHYDIDQAGVWVEAIRKRQPVIHNDYAALPNKHGLPPGHAVVLREMVVPVFRKGLIVAVLGVGNKSTAYTDNDMQIVAQLADLAWDFAEGKRLEAELVESATTDFLTGLFNRRNCIARMDTELARFKRFDIPRATVLMLDLDHFKRVNDEFGHAVGDAVLRHFAAIVRAELRKIDTGGRLGGEEFAILLVGADLTAAAVFAERLRNKVADTPLVHEGQAIPVTVSIGIAALDAGDASSETTLMRADAALYDAKRGGRNRVCVYRR